MAGTSCFYDGKFAKSHIVTPSIVGDTITIKDINGLPFAHWVLGDLEVIEGKDGLWITSKTMPDATLIVSNNAVIDKIRSRLKHKPQKQFAHKLTLLKTLSIIAIAAITGLAVFILFPILSRPIASLVPLEWEKSIGKDILKSLPGANVACRRAKGVQALKQLTTKLSKATKLPFPVEVTIAKLEFKNAFAVPGGFIVISDKLLQEIRSQDEFAAILAHEMAHVAELHPSTRIIQALGLTAFFKLLFSGSSQLPESVAQSAGLLLLLSYSRDDERQADKVSLQIMSRANIKAGGLKSFFTRMEKKASKLNQSPLNTLPSWLLTHPSLSERKTLTANIDKKHSKPAMSDSEWAALRLICNN